MLRWKFFASVAVCLFALSLPVLAQQQQPQDQPQNEQSADVSAQSANGSANDASPEAAPPIGAPGSRFLVTLETRISTKQDKAGKAFLARTLDAIVLENGTILPPGTAVRGHVSKIHPAETMDKARLWLTFDEIHTPAGWAPLAANLIDAPEAQKLHVLYDREGAIEYAPVKRDAEILAALAAAMSGASNGVADKNAKDAATGAAEAAAEAFMATSGMGQEITLEPSLKLQLALARPIRPRRA